MALEPRIRVSALLRWRDRILAATTSRGCQASLFDPDPVEVAA